MEPNLNAFAQFNLLTREEQKEMATAAVARMESLAAATATDVDMASLTDATETTMIGLTGGSAEGLEDTLLAVDDPGDSVILTLGEISGQWETIGYTSLYDEDGDTIFHMDGIRFEDLNCSAGQFLTIKDQKMVCVTIANAPGTETLTIIREVPMWTISNLLVVAIVAAIVFKLMPKLTLRNFFKAVWKLVIRPFKRKEQAISDEWSKAEFETRDK